MRNLRVGFDGGRADQSVRKTFDQELASLCDALASMGAVVEDMLEIAIRSLETRDAGLAREVEKMDDIVDKYNIDIESDALKLLALQQPMARDLRTVAAAMKIITDVERAGDYAVDIAKITERLADEPLAPPTDYIPVLGRKVREMLRETLTAFATRDLDILHQMMVHEDEVDQLYRDLYGSMVDLIKCDPSVADQAISLLLIGRYLERIADHITNIGERIYYMETGELTEFHS